MAGMWLNFNLQGSAGENRARSMCQGVKWLACGQTSRAVVLLPGLRLEFLMYQQKV
jgi:hypothetical protein